MPAQEIKVNPDLQKERNTATFDPHEFSVFWAGGEAKYKEKKSLGKLAAYCKAGINP